VNFTSGPSTTHRLHVSISIWETVACKSVDNGREAYRLIGRLLSETGLRNISELQLLDVWNIMRAFVEQTQR
jgi:hypothetical protein